ncbi:hypothetical protein JOF56_009887 [Kibdelosporangium banguiense]|uniref:CHAT domain-containing protein n=1 Tax=Kibdelosporangium banguiense TaxID=1365924 RepID=A0ABS4TYM4_9PSEU|nr:hypothetical protein [Kibdelosporangium banguiense]MBP2329502.1 hypothetical protein [Kibdelosporangium banguiense]
MTRELPAEVTIDHTDGLSRVAGASYNRARTINLRFIELPSGQGYLVQAWGTAFPEDGGGGYQGRLLRPVEDVNASIDVLRKAWQSSVIEHKYADPDTKRIHHPFADGWNLASRALLDRVALPLARAGYNTFKLLFGGRDEGLQTIRALLLAALCRGANVISIESDTLMVPWGMLYTAPVGEPAYPAENSWSFDGFWGYRHVIEHTFTRIGDFDSRIHLDDRQVVVGLNMDHNVDQQYPRTPYIAPIIDFFTERAKVVLRRNKNELADAFQDPLFPDHITFFGCHGKVAAFENPYLQLGDSEKIYGADILAWLADAPLATRPFVFVGACQGGQVCSAFYSAFGKALLNNGARCLIGPQVDLPPAFACEYSRRLFTDFLEPGAKLGDIVRSLARTFVDEHSNPLGLMFSLYRGMDVHLWTQ